MFGTNHILKKEHNDGQKLRIVQGSPFRTIQGEGPYTGCPAVFLRLHGCNLACTFCDTDFDSEHNPYIDIECLIENILQLFGPEPFKLLVITGGEPLRQNIMPLIQLLRGSTTNITIQIETAGTLWIDDLHLLSQIVCSPKTPTIHPQIYRHACAFKYLIDYRNSHEEYIPITATQKDARPAQLANPRYGAPVYLSPMDNYDENYNRLNRKLVATLAIKYGVHASIQLHKMLELD
jgi:7-carboxy-7-deazaguanine synthase